MTVQSATAFDRLETLAGILRAEDFSARKMGDKWEAHVDAYFADADTFDAAIDELAKRILDHQWRQLHEARSVASRADQRINTLSRLGFS